MIGFTVVGRGASERQAASTNTLSRFETEMVICSENLYALAKLGVQSTIEGLSPLW